MQETDYLKVSTIVRKRASLSMRAPAAGRRSWDLDGYTQKASSCYHHHFCHLLPYLNHDWVISSTWHGTMMPKESYSVRLSTRKALFAAPPFKLEDVNISNDSSIFIVLVNLSSGSFNMYSPVTAQYFRSFSKSSI